MKAYFSVFKLRLIYGLQYRAAALAGVATQFFWGIMHIMIYEAFYANAASARQCPETGYNIHMASAVVLVLLPCGSGIMKSLIS